MSFKVGRVAIVGCGLACSLLFAPGCPRGGRPAVPVATPRPAQPPPSVEARANPVFRLVIPPRPVDEPTRLVALFARIENIDDQELLVRPDRIRLNLPDGVMRFALDKPRAAEILKRAVLARYDLSYLDDQPPPPRGGLSFRQLEYWTWRVREDLLDDTRLPPRGAIEGFLVVDIGRRFRSLKNVVVEANAAPANPSTGAVAHPVRVLLGAPIRVGP